MPQADAIPPDIVCAEDYERHARNRLDPAIWAYVNGAGTDGITARANSAAWSRIRLQGRALADMRGADMALDLVGLTLPHPLILAPVACHGLAHPGGEGATRIGAAATGSLMVVSCEAGQEIEAIAAAATGPLWLQLYLQPSRDDTLILVRKAEAAGYHALVLTVDAPISGLRNEEQRAGFQMPPHLSAVNLQGFRRPEIRQMPGRGPAFLGLMDEAPRWEDVVWLKSRTRLPILLKGIMNSADAVRAVECGADGIIVSNHGGRVLDTLPSTAEALPAIAKAVTGRIPILCDGGIRRGTDALKALALGARAVLIGQPQIHALAVGGSSGIAHLMALLRHELEVAMVLTGNRTLADISLDSIWPSDRPTT